MSSNLSLEPRGRHGRKRRIRYASVLLAAPSVTGAGVLQSEREGRRGSDWQRHLSSTWTAELLAANPDNAFVILVGALRRPGSDSGLHSAKNATVSGALVHRRRCSRRDSTHSVKKKDEKIWLWSKPLIVQTFFFLFIYIAAFKHHHNI